jgi:hypothetical protein
MSFTWTGRSTVTEEWFAPANWEGDTTAPASGEEMESLIFPRLTNEACVEELGTEPCYFSYNDLTGLSAESIRVDDGDDYFIGGDELALGSGGLTASPASGSSGSAGDFMDLPLHLSAAQKWSIADRSGGALEENGMFFGGNLTGSSGLTVELSNGPALILENSTEVGPVTIEGPNVTGERIENGSVLLEDGELNSSDRQPVDLRHIYFSGSGSVGPLTTDAATIAVGSEIEPAEGLDTPSLKLDSASGVLFEVMGSGMTALDDYSQLVSSGPVELAGSIIVEVRKPTAKGACPALDPGSTYTLISTTGRLSGTFANAPEQGPEIPIDYGRGCSQLSQTMRINYNRSGGTETVTGTVEEDVIKQQEEETAAAKDRQEAEAVAVATKKRQEEEAAAAAKKHQEEEAAKSGVLGAKEGSPDASIASTSLQASASGAVTIKVTCPAGVSSCAGTVTLRTLNAVNASVAGAAKSKGSVLTLASGSFNVPGGGVKTVTLHLSAKARALLARLHVLRVRATIIAHDPAGGAHTGQTVATLRAAKSKHGKG